MNKGNLFKGVLLIGMVAFVMAFSSCGDKPKPTPKPDASTTKADAKIAKFKFDGVESTADKNLVLLNNTKVTELEVKSLLAEVKGTVGTSTTEEALTVKDVKPVKATFKATEDTEVTVTVGSEKYNDVTLKFYVRLGTTATTTAYKAHKVEFEIKAGTGTASTNVTAKYGETSATNAIAKSGLLIPENSKLQFTVVKDSKTVKAWTFTTGYTIPSGEATEDTVNVQEKLTKDIKATVELQ